MAFQVSPGVLTTEKDLTTIVPNVSTTVGAMVGPFQWGPILERVQVATENEMKERFGGPNDDIFEDWLSASSFLAYSNNLHIVRTVGDGSMNAVVGGAAAGTAVLVKTEDHHGLSLIHI